jgi:radical SAM superfamily enzyme YgiQ (UPF0313 family)
VGRLGPWLGLISGSEEMKVQLVRPPMNFCTPGQMEDNTSYPVGLCLLAEIVREKNPGVKVEVIDGHKRPLGETLGKINGDVVGATCIYSNYDNALAVLEHAKRKGARTVIGGANVTHIGKRILANREFVDFAVVNDGEETLPEIVSGNAGAMTPNLVYRRDGKVLDSEVKRNAPLTTTFDLEDLVDRERWKPKSIPVSGIRGCMKAEKSSLCDFCSIDHKLKVMNPELMWQQARILKGYGFDYLWEVGETLFPGYLNALLKTRPKDMKDMGWKFYVCADLVNEEFAGALRELGTREVQMGLETPNNNILENINKAARLSDINRAVALLDRNGIDIHAAFMYGLTGETPESAQKTYEFAKSLVSEHPNIKKITTSHAVPFVGTGMFNRLLGSADAGREYAGDLEKDDKFDYEALTRVYDKHFTSVRFDDMAKLVKQTRELMDGRGYGTSFAIGPGDGK